MKKNKAEEGVGGVSEPRGQQGVGGRGEVRDGGQDGGWGPWWPQREGIQPLLWGGGWGGGS